MRVNFKESGKMYSDRQIARIRDFVANYGDDGCTLRQIQNHFGWTDAGTKSQLGRAVNAGAITKHATRSHYFMNENTKPTPDVIIPESVDKLLINIDGRPLLDRMLSFFGLQRINNLK